MRFALSEILQLFGFQKCKTNEFKPKTTELEATRTDCVAGTSGIWLQFDWFSENGIEQNFKRKRREPTEEWWNTRGEWTDGNEEC